MRSPHPFPSWLSVTILWYASVELTLSQSKTRVTTASLDALTSSFATYCKFSAVMPFVHQLAVNQEVLQNEYTFFQRVSFDGYQHVGMGGEVVQQELFCPREWGIRCDQVFGDGGRGVRRLLPYLLCANNSFLNNELANTEFVNPATTVAIKTAEFDEEISFSFNFSSFRFITF
jgi:hypothetical protein